MVAKAFNFFRLKEEDWTFMRALKRIALLRIGMFVVGMSSIFISEVGFHHSSLWGFWICILGAISLIFVQVPFGVLKHLLAPSGNEKGSLLKFFVFGIDCAAAALTVGFMFTLRADFLALYPIHS